MHFHFWGVRGSLPVPGPATTRYGGNTPCVSLELENGPLVVLDSGTGIRLLGQELIKTKHEGKILLLLSHGHWDHIQGFPFFGPAYQPGVQLTIMGYPPGTQRLKHVLSDLMERTHFPIPLDGLSADIEFRELTDDGKTLGSAKLTPIEACHPGGGHGFRIDDEGRSFIYLTDNELPPEGTPTWKRFVEDVRDAHVLIHDTQYTDAEMPKFKGWGHSSVEEAVRLACQANVKTLYLFHHDPDRTDDEIAGLEAAARKLAQAQGSGLQVLAAKEGDGGEV